MFNPLQDLELFLNSPSGILLYHLLAALAAFAVIFLILRKRPRREWKRALLAASLIVLLHALGLFADLFASAGNIGSVKFATANLARAVDVCLTLTVCWFFLFPRRSTAGDIAAGLLAAAILLGAGATTFLFLRAQTDIPFNSHWLSLVWDLVHSAILLGSLLVLLLRRPGGWGISLLAILVFLSGVVLQVSTGSGSTYLPGLARLFLLIGYPLVGMRFALSAATGPAAVVGGPVARQSRQASSVSATPLAGLLRVDEDQDLAPALAEWFCSAMHAETGFILISSEDKNSLMFLSGYDRVNSQPLPAFSMPSESAQQLSFSLEGRQPWRIEKAEAENALLVVAREAGLPQPGPGLFAPLGAAGESIGGILLMAAYSGEEWTDEDLELLQLFGQAGAAAIQHIRSRASLRAELQTAKQDTGLAIEEIERLQKEIMNFEVRLQQAEQEWQKERQRAESLAVLVQEQDAQTPEGAARAQGTLTKLNAELEKTRAELADARRDASRLSEAVAAAAAFREESLRLQEELGQLRANSGAGMETAPAADSAELARLRTALAESEERAGQEIGRLQNELRRTLTEYTHLQSALLQPPPAQEAAKGQLVEPGTDINMVGSIISEIRQPLSSMVGYADLLLSESAGILGAMQRKFMERIRASITRTESLFEDLLQLILLPGKISVPRIQPVDVAGLIDSAISGVSEVVRERNLVLRLDLDEEMPPVEMDRDALQQIINHLVQNAVLATAPEKEVVLTAHAPISEGQHQRALLITVKDSGQGIAAEDQPRVFTRLYRAEGPLIEGLGDTGIGMAVARTLTEALGGRIWLESQVGRGTTFFVLLPAQAGVVLTKPAG